VCGRVGVGVGVCCLRVREDGPVGDDGPAGYRCGLYFGIFNFFPESRLAGTRGRDVFPECLPTGSRGFFCFFPYFLGNPTLFEISCSNLG
jgi:hypothetical protein